MRQAISERAANRDVGLPAGSWYFLVGGSGDGSDLLSQCWHMMKGRRPFCSPQSGSAVLWPPASVQSPSCTGSLAKAGKAGAAHTPNAKDKWIPPGREEREHK